MSQPQSLVSLLRERAQRDPEHPIYLFLEDGEREGARLTVGALDRRARALAAHLQRLGAPGQRALLLFPPGLDFITAFFGCLCGGAVAVPAYPPAGRRDDPRLEAIAADCAPRFILTTSGLLARVAAWVGRSPVLAGATVLAIDAAGRATETAAAGEAEWRDPAASASTLAFLQYTSGSTAQPKGVMVSHGNLLHNERLIARCFHQDAGSVVVSWLPLFHDMGLIGGVLQPLYSGGRAVLMAPAAFLQRPLRWLAAVSRYRGTTGGGPNFAYDLCVRRIAQPERAGLDLSAWTVAFNGAEPVRADTLERFARAFAPCGFAASAFFPCYGLAEATLLVAAKGGTEPPVTLEVAAAALEQMRVVEPGTEETAGAVRRLASSGQVAPEMTVAIVDADSGLPCGPDAVGEIWVAGESVAAGYWRRPEATAETFAARQAGAGVPFLRTGDLGFLRGGELFVTGRAKELIILRGRNLHPEDVERTAERCHRALRPGGGAAFACEVDGEEALVLVHEVERRPAADGMEIAAAVRQAMAEEHQVNLHDIVLIPAGTLPKTSSGKIRRLACRELYRERRLAGLAGGAGAEEGASPRPAAPGTPTAAILRELAAGVLRRPPADLDGALPLTRYGLDSLSAAELQGAVEERLGRRVGLAGLLGGASLDSLESALAEAPTDLAEASERSGVPAAGRWPEGAEVPLTIGQRGLWFLDRLAPESAAYNLYAAAWLVEAPPTPVLRRAFAVLLARHPALRTTVAERDGEPRGELQAPPAEPPFAAIALAATIPEIPAAAGSAAQLAGWLAEEAHRPFDLARELPLRVRVFELAGGRRALLVVAHHIATDFASFALLAGELARWCAGEGDPPLALPPRLVPADFAVGETQLLAGEAGERLWDYWRRQLADAPARLDLPADRPPAAADGRGGGLWAHWGPAVHAGLTALARRHGATLYMVLLASFQVLLHRLSGQEDLVVGSPMAAPGAGAAGAGARGVGYGVNPVPLRSRVAADPPFADHLAAVRDSVLGAHEHQAYPFALLAERLRPERDPDHHPVFQTLFTFLTALPGSPAGLAAFALGAAGARLDLGSLVLDAIAIERRSSSFELALSLAPEAPGADGLAALFQYDAARFDRRTIERWAGHLGMLLAGVEENPRARLSELPLLSPAERRQVVEEWGEWSEGARGERREPPLQRGFEEQAARRPDAVALVGFGGSGAGAGSRLSYGELEARSNRLARRLRQCGVGPEMLVGVCRRRDPELVVSLLAVLKAGGAYVPLDPAYPAARTAGILADSAARLVLTESAVAPAGAACPALCADTPGEREAVARLESGGLGAPVPAEALAYVIYTSGSTGRPKGVAIAHRAAVHLVAWASAVFTPAELAGVVASTSICFDLSVFELFVPLSLGGTVLLVENALALPRLAAEALPTLLNTVPSLLAELLAAGPLPASLRTVNLAGEALPGALVEHIDAKRVLNLYGPSEDTTYSTWARVAGGAVPAIGRPVAPTRAYVLDRRGALVPPGAAGELYLGGEKLARGYWRRPRLTAERFLPDPYGATPGGRLYRTGDLVRHRPNGALHYLGRADRQLKLRGIRIEPAEIEAALLRQPGVREALVEMAAMPEMPEPAGDRGLVAYLSPAGGAAIDGPALRRALAGALPDAMIPTVWVELAALPRLPNGKLDRARLPRLPRPRRPPPSLSSPASAALVAPRGACEEILAAIWAEALGVERVGRDDDFFALGGHSLLGLRILSRLREALGVELPLRTLFAAPTLAGLAAEVERGLRGGKPAGEETAAVVRRREGPLGSDLDLPLSWGQQGLWLAEQLGEAGAAYGMPAAIPLLAEVAPGALAWALGEVARRHEVLRTTYPNRGGRPAVRLAAVSPGGLAVCDLDALAPAAADAESARLAAAEARRPFDLARGPLLRTVLLRQGAAGSLLLVAAHHIVADGESIAIFRREIESLLASCAAGVSGASNTAGRPAPLAELPVQFADYAAWQRRTLAAGGFDAGLAFWRRSLAGVPTLELAGLAGDTARPGPGSVRGGLARRQVAGLAGLRGLAGRQGLTPFMLLLPVVAVVLSRHSGQEDFAFGTPMADRDRPELAGLIGLLVHLVGLRVDLAGDPSLAELATRVRTAALLAYEHRRAPLEALWEGTGIGAMGAMGEMTGHAGRHPLFQVTFAVEDRPAGRAASGEVLGPIQPLHSGTAKFDLGWVAGLAAAGLSVELEYRRDNFDAATVERLLDGVERLLGAALAAPLRPLSQLPWLAESELAELLVERNRTATEDQQAAAPMIHERVAACAARLPAAVAVVAAGGAALTYGELDRRANRLALCLRRRGLGAESIVGVLLERTPELVVSWLAVLKAGAAYLPLDPANPPQRTAAMLQAAGALITQGPLPAALRGGVGEPAMEVIDLAAEELAGLDGPAAAVPVDGAHLAYVIFTSGSTGEPKGVAIPHRGLANLVAWHLGEYAVTAADRATSLAGLGFDAAAWEVWPYLAVGAAVHLVPAAVAAAPLALADWLEARAITLCFLPTPLAEAVLAERPPRGALRAILTGGDRLHAAPPAPLGYPLVNHYGPTESTVVATAGAVAPVTPGKPGWAGLPAIGRPIANTRVYLLDRHLRPVPAGAPGELFVAGRGEARGYAGSPAHTAERFLPDPFGPPGGRMYRSGDLARWRAGTLDFLGRADRQVKIRGVRIELGEIEAALAGHPEVREAAVVAVAERPGARDLRLAAYWVPRQAPGPATEDLRRHLRDRLPGAMIPAELIALPALPLSPSGKVDRAALPAPESFAARRGALYVAPRTMLEETLAEICGELLEQPRLGVLDDLQSLGMHSLKITQAVSRIRDLFAVEIAPRAVYESATVAGLSLAVARALVEASAEPEVERVLAEAREG